MHTNLRDSKPMHFDECKHWPKHEQAERYNKAIRWRAMKVEAELMANTMRAVRVHDWGAPPVVDEVPVPRPTAGESLVRVEAAAVAHLDRTVAGGDFDIKPKLPYIGGVEGCGRVVESSTHPEGTRVMLRGGGLGLLRDGTGRSS